MALEVPDQFHCAVPGIGRQGLTDAHGTPILPFTTTGKARNMFSIGVSFLRDELAEAALSGFRRWSRLCLRRVSCSLRFCTKASNCDWFRVSEYTWLAPASNKCSCAFLPPCQSSLGGSVLALVVICLQQETRETCDVMSVEATTEENVWLDTLTPNLLLAGQGVELRQYILEIQKPSAISLNLCSAGIFFDV